MLIFVARFCSREKTEAVYTFIYNQAARDKRKTQSPQKCTKSRDVHSFTESYCLVYHENSVELKTGFVPMKT